MPPFGVRASFEPFPFVDGGRRILGSNYGSADPAVDFPRYAALHLAGRLPVERTDVEPDDVVIGGRVEMTFRKRFTADGIHNYFWKARPVRTGAAATGEGS